MANPSANAAEIVRVLEQLTDSDIVLFPELSVTGYTCADLFGQETLLDAAFRRLCGSPGRPTGRAQLVVVGVPIPVGNSLFNCAVAITTARFAASSPSSTSPTTRSSTRAAGSARAVGDEPAEIDLGGQRVPFGIDLLFESTRWQGLSRIAARLSSGIEICEDLWVPRAAECVSGHGRARRFCSIPRPAMRRSARAGIVAELVVGQSGRLIAAYAMAGCGPSESTTDVVFGGHCLIAENGQLLAESPRVGDGLPITARLLLDHPGCRRRQAAIRPSGHRPASTTPWNRRRPFRRIPFSLADTMDGLKRQVPGTPFVPAEGAELHRRCAEIFGIQCAGLAKRIEQLPARTRHSTWAFPAAWIPPWHSWSRS